MIEHNPLKQYFRRPGIYLKLPSGGTSYGPEVLTMPPTNEIPVYPMTAIDEITSKTPDSLYNGAAVADIITSCVPAVKDPWAITSTDLDALLVAIKIATNGQELDIESTCPKCDEESKFGINLSMILNGFTAGDYSKTLDIGELKIKFRPLNYKELTGSSVRQFEIQKALLTVNGMEEGPEKDAQSSEMLKVITRTTIEVLANTIEFIQTPEVRVDEKAYIIDFLENTDKKTFESIRETSVKLRETTQTQPLKITCTHCQYEYEQPFTLNVSDFFA